MAAILCCGLAPRPYLAGLRDKMMASTSALFSFELSCSLPFFSRPLAAASCMLSLAVPKKRWAGFTQSLLSHLWHTYNPFGIGPFFSSYDTRCAGCALYEPTLKFPYPPDFFAPRQFQQPRPSSDRETFAQNLSSTMSCINSIVQSLHACPPFVKCREWRMAT